MRGLRGRLFALVAVALLPAFAVEVMFLVGLHYAKQDDINRDVMRQAQLVNETVSTIVEGARQLTYSLAQSGRVAALDPACRETLLAVKSGLPNYRFLSVLDPEGRLVCTSWPAPNSAGLGQRPYLHATLAADRFTVGDFSRGAASGEPFLPLAHPVRARDGRAIGVIVAGLDLTWLGEQLARLDRPEQSTIVIADRRGIVLARYPDSAQWAGKAFLPENMGMVEAKAPGIRRTAGYDGRERITGYIPPAASATGLSISVGIYPPSVMAPIWRLAAWSGVAIGIGLFASCTLAWAAGERLVRRPLADLARGASLLAAGDLSTRVADAGKPREIGALACAFNDMAATLEKRARERDIAEQELRTAQDALARINTGLEERVADEVEAREAAQFQLRQSEKVNALGQLAGGVAHDFNNLLTAVLGNLQLLRKRLPEDDARAGRLLENAVQGAERGAALTQRLLAFGRRQALQPEAVDVPDLVRGMSDLLQSSLGAGIQVETHFPIALAPAYVDANQLELALLNLAMNARDAMAGSGRLVIAAREEPGGLTGPDPTRPDPTSAFPVGASPAGASPAGASPAGASVVLSVTDTGIGMDEATLARAADPFFTTKGLGKGTGLGLSMVHGLAAQSGGKLVLCSTPGKGTTAELWLPQAEEAVSPRTAEARAPESAPNPARRLTVLAVDDDPLVLASTTAMLEDLGHAVVEAMSGRQALEILRAGARVDMVVTDQSMPVMSGLQLAGEVHQLRPALPVLLATGYAERAEVVGSGLPIMAKPFDQPALAKAIFACMGTPSGTGQVVAFRPR